MLVKIGILVIAIAIVALANWIEGRYNKINKEDNGR